METLGAALMLWISVNFGMPVERVAPPAVERIPAEAIARIHHQPDAPATESIAGHRLLADLTPAMRTVVAVYDSRTATIYLPEDWSAGDAADLSVLVHELVHHLQFATGARYGCPQERERLAFDAQDAWLKQFGSSLEEAFGIDPFTRLVRTICGY